MPTDTDSLGCEPDDLAVTPEMIECVLELLERAGLIEHRISADRALAERVCRAVLAYSRNRKGYEPDELGLTSEMIEAGVLKLYSYDPDFGNENDVVSEIFREMLNLAEPRDQKAAHARRIRIERPSESAGSCTI